MKNILLRNALATAIFWFVFYIQMAEVFEASTRNVISLLLMAAFVFIIPLRASFRRVWDKLNGKAD